MSENLQRKDTILSIVGYFPVLSLIALGYGIVNQSVYYSIFNINILKYTEVSELLLDTLNHLVVIMLPITIFFAFSIFLINKKLDKIYHTFPTDKLVQYRVDSEVGYKRRTKIGYWIIAICFFVSIITICIEYLVYEQLDTLFLLMAITQFGFLLIFFFYLDWFKKFYKDTFKADVENNLYLTLLIVISLLGISIYKGLYDGSRVKKHSTKGIYIIREKDTLFSTNNYYFIGNTKNYIFFFDEYTKHTDIIDAKTVKLLSIN